MTTTQLPVRTARVLNETDVDRVQAYMPGNYSVEVTDDGLTIIGTDRAGWTLDGYVIPRLASGLIFAEEVTA